MTNKPIKSIDDAIKREIKVYNSNRKLYKEALEQYTLETFFVTGYGLVFYSLEHILHPQTKYPIQIKLSTKQIRGIVFDVLLDLDNYILYHKPYTDLINSTLAMMHGKSEWGIPVDMSQVPKLPKLSTYKSKRDAISEYMAYTDMGDKRLTAVEKENDKLDKAITNYWKILKPIMKQILPSITPKDVLKTFGIELPTMLMGQHLLRANRKI